jgi:hypothetical protein
MYPFCHRTWSHFSLRFTAERRGASPIIHGQLGLAVGIRFLSQLRFVGRYSARLELSFSDTSDKVRFIIVRDISATIGDQAAYRDLAPVAPYEAPTRNRFQQIRPENVIPGVREKKQHPYKTKLGQYMIPKTLLAALESGSQDVGEVISRLPAPYRPRPLETSSYIPMLQAQLWIEEYKAKSVYHLRKQNCRLTFLADLI